MKPLDVLVVTKHIFVSFQRDHQGLPDLQNNKDIMPSSCILLSEREVAAVFLVEWL